MEGSPQRTAWLPSVRVYQWERDLVDEALSLERVKMSEFIRRVLVDNAKQRVAGEVLDQTKQGPDAATSRAPDNDPSQEDRCHAER